MCCVGKVAKKNPQHDRQRHSSASPALHFGCVINILFQTLWARNFFRGDLGAHKSSHNSFPTILHRRNLIYALFWGLHILLSGGKGSGMAKQRARVPSLTYDDAREDHWKRVRWCWIHKKCYPFSSAAECMPIHKPNIKWDGKFSAVCVCYATAAEGIFPIYSSCFNRCLNNNFIRL